jgi:serine O-acetyltransferase
MLRALGMLHEDLKAKARRYYKDDNPKSLIKTLAADGTSSMVLYRLQQGAREAGLGPLEALFYKLNAAGGCIIGRGADFGPGFVLLHANGVVINGKVKGGSNVQIQHQVTIGNNEREEAPELGSDIVIGAGAKVIGPVRIGDGARVGANAVVVHSVDDHTTVVGIPAKPVKRRAESASANGTSSPGDEPS